MTSPLDRLIGSPTCRVYAPDVAWHVWRHPAKRGTTCECGKLRVARVRQNGEIVAEDAPVSDHATPTQDRLEEIETYYKDMPDQSMVKWLIEEVKRLRLPDDLAEEMRSAAREDARSLNAEIKIALRWWLIARRKKR